MAGLLEKPTTDPAAEAAVPPGAAAPAPEPEAPARTCATCSAALVEGQDWCLECGSAQPGRLGGRPGWRAALTMLAVTALLVGGAGAAAYAALTSEAQRDATAAAPPQAAPTVAAPPPAEAPAPPAEETPAVEAPKSDPADVPAPSDSSDDDTPVTSTPSGSTSAGSTSGDRDATGAGGADLGGDTPSDTAPAERVAIDLPAKAARLYDPFGRAADAGSKPANAVDGKESTAFELPVDPADGTVRAGLVLSLDEAKTLSDLEMTAGTPGFTVEVYATRSKELPPDVLDSRWEHAGDRRDVGVMETVELDGTFRHVLLWITEQPADTKVAIPEVQLYD